MSVQSYPTIRLGEAVDRVTKGTTPTTHGYPYTDDGVSFLRVGNLQNGVVDTSRAKTFISPEANQFLKRSSLESGDVLISIAGTIGRTAIVRDHDIPANTNQAVAIIRGAAKRFEPVFLRFALESPLLHRHITGEARGGAMQNISLENVRDVVVPIPALDEQRRIVAEIEKQFTRLEAGVAALRRVQANLKRYRAAVLKAACEGDWSQKPLGEIAEIRLGKMLDKAKHVRGRKLQYLRNVNVRWGKTDTDDLREMYFEDDELERYGLRAGDVLVCEGGEPGRATVWSGHLPEMKYQKAIHRVRFNIPFEPRLLVWLLERLALTGGLERRFTGSTIKHFTREAFIELPVPVPPLAEQTRIVAEVERRLSVVEELESVVTANLQRATRLRQSILQKAFTGELVVQSVVLPTNVIELPKAKRNQRPNTHFARALLSAEIVHLLHREPTFGRIKHQKIFHLCEHIAQMEEIQGQYHREAAGPLDNKLIYANEAELKKQKWYQEVQRESYGHAYEPLAKAGNHRKYVEGYWPDKLPLIEKLIELMRGWDTDRCEIFCTTYAAWNDLIILGKEPTDAAILREILERWHDSKKRFPKDRWLKAIGWMRTEGFVPTGFGKPTRVMKRK